ncbi:MAG: HEAT repeat domain-containing protein [Bacteroidota bacterium]
MADLRHHSPGNNKFGTYLLAQSNLPGKRGNLELAFAFAEYIEEQYPVNPERAWSFCEALITENPPRKNFTGAEEFLPFCGVLGLGRIGSTDPAREPDALIYVKSAACDERWRIREAAAMAIQDLMDVRPEATIAILQGWIQEDSYLLHRAIAAGVAEPRFMKNLEIARYALELHKAILENVAREPDKRDPDYLVLVKGLCYTLSVVITGIEQEGFAYLEDLLAKDHPVTQKIVRENLKKKRLMRLNAKKVAGLQQKLSNAN